MNITSKSKAKLIQSRPEPPGLEEVKADLEKADNNDVAFTFFSTFSTDDQQDKVTEQRLQQHEDKCEMQSAATISSHLTSSSNSQSSSKESDINACYTKVMKFLEINETLKQSQESLADQCSELQELGEAVKEQVNRLRTQMT